MNIPRPYRAIIPPIVTPLLDVDVLDVKGLEKLVEHQIAGGVHGIFVLGTTGEAPSLSYRLRSEMLERTIALVAGRVPVLMGVTDCAYAETLRLTDLAARSGASAVVLAPPFYFSTSQGDLLRIVENFNDASPLPVFLYNIPQMTKTAFAPETVARAAQMSNIYGLKDSSGSMDYVRQILAAVQPRGEFTILLGSEHLLMEGLQIGVDGGVHGGANLFPELYVRLFNAWEANDQQEVQRLHAKVIDLGNALYDATDAEYRYIRGLKYALSAAGLCSDLPAWPFEPAGTKHQAMISRYLRTFSIG
jgi:dihydrodipicolinate synthase/N-acetylneuraminate lyase